MRTSFFQKFKRVTYSTSYLPEIDGLRFLAVFMVVVIMHITNYMNEKFFEGEWIQAGYNRGFMLGGGMGVSLFFMISGFILSLPFARWRLNGHQPVPLRNYYLRRVFRLEPPYILALVIFFIAHVWVLHSYSFENLLPHFFASITYTHLVVYKSFSPVLPIAWTLEVEVQFYVLAPVLCLVFLIRKNTIRWALLSVIIIAGTLYWYDVWEMGNIVMTLHFFLGGMLLADLYCCNVRFFRNRRVSLSAGVVAFLGFLLINPLHGITAFSAKFLCMFLLFHTALTDPVIKRAFSNKVLACIGGMCYSIYLMHFAVIAALGLLLINSGLNVGNKAFILPFLILFMAAILLVSASYFLLVEKPFMKPIGLKQKAERQPDSSNCLQ